VVAVTDYAEGELFQILEDDGNLPEEQVCRVLFTDSVKFCSVLYLLHRFNPLLASWCRLSITSIHIEFCIVT
jgi:hypothetical protein